MAKNNERAIEAEKDLYDLIPRLKGIHGRYVIEHDPRALINLAKAADAIHRDCRIILDTYDNPDLKYEIR